MDKDSAIFDDKSFADIVRDIYKNQKTKGDKIQSVLETFLKNVSNANTAVLIGPIIKDCLDVSVKNDELLVKLTGILQRLLTDSTEKGPGEFGITEEEKQTLLKEINSLNKLEKKLT